MSRGARLELRSVSAAYAGVTVVHEVSLEGHPGTVLALLGPSGCGKTTLLRVVAGLMPPSGGTVAFDGEVIDHIPAERRGAAMVFQKPLLFPHMDVAGNVGFGLRMQKRPGHEIRQRVAEALEMVHMQGFGSRRPGELSGGQEQRVALARALVIRPRVLLLDEPFSALDESLREEMRTLVRRLQRALGITTAFVTHDQTEAAQMADTIALLLDGRLEQSGTPRDFYERPRTAAAALFFGWKRWPDGRFYRPEQARLSDSARDGEASAEGVVEDVVDAGTHLRCLVRVNDAVLEVHERPRPVAAGEAVTVCIHEATMAGPLPGGFK